MRDFYIPIEVDRSQLVTHFSALIRVEQHLSPNQITVAGVFAYVSTQTDLMKQIS